MGEGEGMEHVSATKEKKNPLAKIAAVFVVPSKGLLMSPGTGADGGNMRQMVPPPLMMPLKSRAVLRVEEGGEGDAKKSEHDILIKK
eukprot:Nk52_evm57s2118 gene=Nk52_evmTU57s2118